MNTPSRARSSGSISSRSLPSYVDRAAGDFVAGMAGQHPRERALARAVRSHDGVHLPGVDRERQPLQNFLVLGPDAEVFDFEQHAVSSSFNLIRVGPHPQAPVTSRPVPIRPSLRG